MFVLLLCVCFLIGSYRAFAKRERAFAKRERALDDYKRSLDQRSEALSAWHASLMVGHLWERKTDDQRP
jgi:hypothetical protein